MIRTVMVVDDDDDIREVIGMLLETEGYRVQTAADGAEALERLEAHDSVGLILIDLMMPRMDGARFIELLRGGNHCGTPVVVMSGHDEAETRSKQIGADAYIVKPIDADDLFNLVERFLH